MQRREKTSHLSTHAHANTHLSTFSFSPRVRTGNKILSSCRPSVMDSAALVVPVPIVLVCGVESEHEVLRRAQYILHAN